MSVDTQQDIKLDSDTRKVNHPIRTTKDENGKDVPVTEEFSYQYAVPLTIEGAIALCGGLDRLLELIGQRNKARVSAYFTDARYKSIEDESQWETHKSDALAAMADIDAPLASSRGTGVTAKAKKYDDFQTRMQNAKSDEEKLALLAELGY